jgi:hypothetical protein
VKRVYYHHEDREECAKDGMWRIVSGHEERERFVLAAAALMRQPEHFRAAMFRVIEDWPKSCAPALAGDKLVAAAKQSCVDLGGPNAKLLWQKVAPDGALPEVVGKALIYAAAAVFAAYEVPEPTDPQEDADLPADMTGLVAS